MSAAAPSVRFEALDSLRGIAAIGVAYGHFYGSDIMGGTRHFAFYLLVDLFFVLSGFVLAHRYLDDWFARRLTLSHFAVRRFARLYPMNLFGLLGVLAISLFMGAMYGSPELPAWNRLASGIETYADGSLFTFILTLFLAQNIGFTPLGPSWHAPSWSISVEFYALLLLFFWIGLWRDNKNTTFVAPTVLLAVACVMAVFNGEGSLAVGGHDILPWVNYGLLRGLAEAAIGVLTYRFFRAFGNRLDRGGIRAIVVEIALLAGIALMLFRPKFVAREDIFVIPLFAALIVCLALPHSVLARFLQAPPFQWTGRISYSIYINHYLIAIAMSRAVYKPGWLYFALVLALSWLTYRYIEVPGRAMLNRNLAVFA